MPRYRLPSGKTFFSEKELSSDELDEMMDELEPPIPTESVPVKTTGFETPEPTKISEEPVEEPEGDLARLVAGLPPRKPKESLISQFFDTINEPMTQSLGGTFEQKRARDMLAQGKEILAEEHPILNFIGATGENLLTPINLATGGALGLGRSLGSRALLNTGRALSGVTAASGVENTLEAETWPQRIAGILETIGGLAGTRTKMPVKKVGPAQDFQYFMMVYQFTGREVPLDLTPS